MPFDSIDNVLFIKTDEFDSKFDTKFHAFLLFYCIVDFGLTAQLSYFNLFCGKMLQDKIFSKHISVKVYVF